MKTDEMESATKTPPNAANEKKPDSEESSDTASTNNEDAPGGGTAEPVMKEKEGPGPAVYRVPEGEEDDAEAYGRHVYGGQNAAAAVGGAGGDNNMEGGTEKSSADKIPREPKMPPSLHFKFKDEGEKNGARKKLVTPPRRSLSRSPSGSPVSPADLSASSQNNRASRSAGSRSPAGVIANNRMPRSAFASAGGGGGYGYDEGDDSPYYDLSGMEGLTQEEIYEMLYEEQLLAAAGVGRSGLTEEERAARRERIKRRRELRAKTKLGEAGGEYLGGEEGGGKSGPKYYRAADGTLKKIRTQPEYLEDLMEGGVPIKSWLIVCALLGVGLFQLGRTLKAPKAGDSTGKGAKHVKNIASDSPGSPSRKRGPGKAKGKKSGSGKSRSASTRKHSKSVSSGAGQKKANLAKKPTEESPKELSASGVIEEEKKESEKTLPTRKVPEVEKEAEPPLIDEELDVEVLLSPKNKSAKKKRVRKKTQTAQASETDKAELNGHSGNAPPSAVTTDKPPSLGSDNAATPLDKTIAEDEAASSAAAISSPEPQQQEFLAGMDDKDRRAVMEALGEDEWQKHAADEGGWQTAGSRKATRKKSSARGNKEPQEKKSNKGAQGSGRTKNNRKGKSPQSAASSEGGASAPAKETKTAQTAASTDDFSAAVAAIDQLPLPSETTDAGKIAEARGNDSDEPEKVEGEVKKAENADVTEDRGKVSNGPTTAKGDTKESKHLNAKKADATEAQGKASGKPITAEGDAKDNAVEEKKADVTDASDRDGDKPITAKGGAASANVNVNEVDVTEARGKDSDKRITVDRDTEENTNNVNEGKTDPDAQSKIIDTKKTNSQPEDMAAPAKERKNAPATTSSAKDEKTEETKKAGVKPKERPTGKTAAAEKNGEKKQEEDSSQRKAKPSTKTVVPSREKAQSKENVPSMEDDAALARKLQMQEENLAASAGQAEDDAWEQVVTKKSKRRSAAGGQQVNPSVQQSVAAT